MKVPSNPTTAGIHFFSIYLLILLLFIYSLITSLKEHLDCFHAKEQTSATFLTCSSERTECVEKNYSYN